jgi:hypothetical protein
MNVRTRFKRLVRKAAVIGLKAVIEVLDIVRETLEDGERPIGEEYTRKVKPVFVPMDGQPSIRLVKTVMVETKVEDNSAL